MRWLVGRWGGERAVVMSGPVLTSRLVAAVEDETSGATGVVRQVIDGLLALAGESDRLRAAADLLAAQLPWCAPMWHVVRAAHATCPVFALRSLRSRLDSDVDRSVAGAARLVTERGCAVRAAPGSALVSAVLEAVAAPARPGGVAGLAGADGLGPTAVLNVVGTRDLACAVPTIVVTTSVKLVPGEAFQRLGAPGFERVPLWLFEAVVLDGEVLTPTEAGRRAATLG
jgi:hypothetical protein